MVSHMSVHIWKSNLKKCHIGVRKGLVKESGVLWQKKKKLKLSFEPFLGGRRGGNKNFNHLTCSIHTEFQYDNLLNFLKFWNFGLTYGFLFVAIATKESDYLASFTVKTAAQYSDLLSFHDFLRCERKYRTPCITSKSIFTVSFIFKLISRIF